MQSKVIAFNNAQRASAKGECTLRSGDVVKVHRKIKEGNKERIQIFEGMIIAVKGGQSSSPMITVRKVSAGGYGVEIIVPVNSPSIEKVELVKRAKVRRSKLYYVRDKAAKALRFKFTDVKDIAVPAFIAAQKDEAAEESEGASKDAEKSDDAESTKEAKEDAKEASDTVVEKDTSKDSEKKAE